MVIQPQTRLMLSLLALDIVIVAVSWYVPTDLGLVRSFMAVVQMLFLVATGIVTLRYALNAL